MTSEAIENDYTFSCKIGVHSDNNIFLKMFNLNLFNFNLRSIHFEIVELLSFKLRNYPLDIYCDFSHFKTD